MTHWTDFIVPATLSRPSRATPNGASPDFLTGGQDWTTRTCLFGMHKQWTRRTLEDNGKHPWFRSSCRIQHSNISNAFLSTGEVIKQPDVFFFFFFLIKQLILCWSDDAVFFDGVRRF
jgi:hypothetical protein